MKKLTVFGCAASIGWVFLFGIILWQKRADAANMALNDWGDFLSGATAPLALLWLIIGYFLQGEELRLNTDALKMQEQELKNQVRETATLAANSERQAAAAEQMASATLEEKNRTALRETAESMPIFRSSGGSSTAASLSTNIKNVGATISAVTAKAEKPGMHVSIFPKEVFEAGAEGKLKSEGATTFPFSFSISFKDRLGMERTKRYEMRTPHSFTEIAI